MELPFHDDWKVADLKEEDMHVCNLVRRGMKEE